SWSQIVSPTTPPVGRARATAAFDPNRSEIVLAGGERPSTLLRDAWSFDGSRWQPIPLQGQRPMRSFAALAVEPSGSSVLAFSGLGISTTPAADTWRWDGRAWSQLNVPGPSPRVAAATCTSPTAVWLYGGDNWGSGSAFSDLWRWDGTAWTQVVAAGPSARTGAGMTWDLQANVAVLFGGATPLTLPTDTWTFDGVAWQQQVTTTAPTGRWSPAMAFDPVLGRTVLCGGISGASPLTDTWLWDGTAWSPVPSGSLPVGHQATTAAFDLQRLQVVARTTSTTTGYLGWSFDGQAWNQIGATPPSYEMLYATWDGKLLGYPYTFGLLHGEGMNLHSLSATAASATPYGGTCGQNAPTVAASTWPRLAEAGFEVELVRAQPSSFAVVLGAVQPASLPLLGCTLLVPPGQAAVLLPTDVRGNAALALPIPASIGFLGVALHFQAAAPDPNAPAGFAMSRGLRIGIGD
ncbi:MAG: hypothetical protein KDE27_06750, partial [Planctomycetes bacterium]|nr:hypothetical protein [Planctomycetota bacterium]